MWAIMTPIYRCEIDPHFLETPIYSKLAESTDNAYVYQVRLQSKTSRFLQEMSVFKFPGEDNVLFQCRVSLCDMDGNEACTKMIVSISSVSFIINLASKM